MTFLKEELFLNTEDKVKIAIDYYSNANSESVVIIAPGWCMTKNSKAFVDIAESFAQKHDVISMDFRGHGRSGGFYTFSAKEIEDLKVVVDFAKEKGYKKINLAGFSLGGAVVLIYAALDVSINSVIAVSAPCEFGKIENQMWQKAAWGETFKKFEFGRFCSIRPWCIPEKKIKPIDVVDRIQAPTLFIAGEKDPTVFPWHTKVLWEKATCEKQFKLYENGFHAEDLFLYFKDDFMSICENWLSEKVNV